MSALSTAARFSPALRRMRGTAAAAAIALSLAAAAAALAVVMLRGPSPPSTLSGRVEAVASTLRCPVCRDLSVADSPSAVARQMRVRIANDLRAGKSPAQVRQEFVSAYGDWILLAPPRRGLDLVAWAAPFVALVAGLLLALATTLRWIRGGGGGAGRRARPTERPVAPDTSLHAVSERQRRLLEAELAGIEEEAE